MSTPREAFLAGDRHDDVALFFADGVVEDERLERAGERVDGGVVLIVDGERGRNAFRAATGVDAMDFAGSAMELEGSVDTDLAGGSCPEGAGEPEDETDEANDDRDHETRFMFAFTEAQNEAVGGIYADGDVLHAYAQCVCGAAYSDRWVIQTDSRHS